MQTPISFSSLPHDIHLNIISFLKPLEISSLSCTCTHFSSLCNPSSPSLWFALCSRRWGTLTDLQSWSAAPSHRLYKTLARSETLIGFWRLIINNNISSSPSLVFFEWCNSCVAGFRVSPSPSSYSVRKIPFLRLGFSAAGEASSRLSPDVVPVTVSFMGCNHFVVEETRADAALEDWEGLVSEKYRFFANREDGRKRKKKGRRRWEADHFVKISDCCPTAARPLQGLWKVIVCFEVMVFCLKGFWFDVWKRGMNWINHFLKNLKLGYFIYTTLFLARQGRDINWWNSGDWRLPLASRFLIR